MEAQSTSVPENKGSQESEEDASPGGFTEPGAPSQTSNPSPELECETGETKVREEERTLTDHLNKRLLSSFLEKLNQRDLALPGIQRLDCAVAGEEDSNRAVEECVRWSVRKQRDAKHKHKQALKSSGHERKWRINKDKASTDKYYFQ
ncbi:hypothetical protein AAFF_G00257290 [Aldrovandia affinis]|uniref:Uncharacterized protein n=1 Tax=Aldrovandia affinis TaxID=143900 RepID=A0AAD7WTE1_9TELE|nr:hypothetical protein AAFF_G00257290 [Aldrovandia affinis]